MYSLFPDLPKISLRICTYCHPQVPIDRGLAHGDKYGNRVASSQPSLSNSRVYCINYYSTLLAHYAKCSMALQILQGWILGADNQITFPG